MKNFLIILILFSEHLTAQTFSISGEVTDSLGNSLTQVNIIVLETKTGAASDKNGKYFIENLKPGSYTLGFSIIGYQTESLPNITITDKPVTLNVVLREQPVESEQVIVTAGKYEQKISELPVSAEVLGSEIISKKNFSDLEDVLRYVPGVNMTDDQISIRGSSGYSRGAGSRVLLAIDGIPFYTGDTGETIWEVVPLTTLDHIEITKGAASSLYGSTAIGGVVNLITKKIPENQTVFLKSYIGAYDKPAYDEWDWSGEYRMFNGQTISYANTFNDVGFYASFSRLEDTGYKQNNFSKRYIGFLKGDIKLTATSSLMLHANIFNKKSGNFVYWRDSHNALVPPQSDLGQVVKADRNMFGAIYKQVLSDNILLNIKGSYYHTYWDDGANPNNKSKTDLFRGEVQLNSSFSNSFVIVSGLEASGAQVNSNLFGNPTSFSLGGYSHADWKFDVPLIASIGLRYDYNKLDTLKASNALSPKLGFNYKFSDNLIFRTSVGTGFRAPTPAEAFTSTTTSGITVKPNPNLKSETNLTIEGGINYKLDKPVTFDFALFNNEFYDFIEPGVDPADGLIIFDNVTRARIQGLEFQSLIDLEQFNTNITLSYTYLWARNIEEKKVLKYRPRNVFYLRLDYSLHNFIAGADFRYWSRVEEIDNELIDLGLVPDGQLRVDVYVLDLRAGYNLTLSGIPLRIFLNVNNILNYNYVELIGNLAPIRNFSLSVEVPLSFK
jgi:outer membrane receptor for ferrienterochelin and colicins